MGKSEKAGKRPSKAKPLARNSSRDTIDLVHLEDIQEKWPQATRKQKVQRHFKRFWCCYTVGIAVLLAVTLPLLYVSQLETMAACC